MSSAKSPIPTPAATFAARKKASAMVAGALGIDKAPDAIARLAKRLGVSEDTITRWATGLNYPASTKVDGIMRELSK